MPFPPPEDESPGSFRKALRRALVPVEYEALGEPASAGAFGIRAGNSSFGWSSHFRKSFMDGIAHGSDSD